MHVHIDEISKTEWKSNAKHFLDYSVYQTWEYQQVRADRDRQYLSRVLIVDDKGTPVLMAQMRIKKVPILGLSIGHIQSGPLIQTKEDDKSLTLEALTKLRQSLLGPKVNVLRLVPNIKHDDRGEQYIDLLSSAGFKRITSIQPYHTMIVSISDSPEEIMSRIDRESRRNIRKTEKNNVTFKKGTSEELFDILKLLYAQAKKRKGFHGIDADDYAEAQKLFPEEEKLKVLIAYHENEPISALATAHFGTTAEPTILANTPKGLKYGSSYMIWWKAYLQAKEFGMQYYDLGGVDKKLNPKGHLFKKRMGGIDVFNIGEFEAYTNCSVGFEWKCVKKLHQLLRNK